MRRLRNILLFTCLITASLAAKCQAITDTERIETIKKQISAEYKSIASIQCGYVMEKTSQLLEEKTTYCGTVSYDTPMRLSWSCVEPELGFTMTADSIFVKNAKGNSAMRLEEHLIFNEIAKIIRGTSEQGSLIDEKSFTPVFSENDSEIVVIMTPKKKKMKGIFANIILTFNKKDYELRKIQILDGGNNSTEIFINNAIITRL